MAGDDEFMRHHQPWGGGSSGGGGDSESQQLISNFPGILQVREVVLVFVFLPVPRCSVTPYICRTLHTCVNVRTYSMFVTKPNLVFVKSHFLVEKSFRDPRFFPSRV